MRAVAGRPCGPTKLHTPEQRITYDLRVCGKLCECRETWNWSQAQRSLRGECKEPFSRQSRLRLLKELAQIRWRDDIRYSLISLTYPDQKAERSCARHTIDRSRYIRDLESLTGSKYGILWRKEWEERKSGERKGQLVLHWHLLAWDIGWVDHRDIRKLWRNILGWGGPLATDIEEATSADKAAFYAAKYAAKPSSCSLDNAAYLNKRWGRPWGFCRSIQIDRYKPIIIRGLSADEFALVKNLAAPHWKGIKRHDDQGFTLFSDVGQEIARSVQKMRLARARASQ